MLILDEYYPTWMLDANATLLSIYIYRDIAKSDVQVPVQLGWCLNTVNKYLRILNLSQYKVSSSGKGPWRVQIVYSSVYLLIISNLIAACRSSSAIICCCVHPDLKNTHSQFLLKAFMLLSWEGPSFWRFIFWETVVQQWTALYTVLWMKYSLQVAWNLIGKPCKYGLQKGQYQKWLLLTSRKNPSFYTCQLFMFMGENEEIICPLCWMW